jgi:hypothetical protein
MNDRPFQMPRPLPPPPPGWELRGRADGGNRTMRYLQGDPQGNQCLHEIRFTIRPPSHRCIFHRGSELRQMMLPVDQWAGLPVHHRLQVEVAALFAITDAPLDTREDP